MVELPEAWITVLNALIAAPVAWMAPAEVATAIGREAEAATDDLCLMDLAGWIEVWETEIEAEPRITLSALAAERLNVHLIEVGLDEVPRWARIGRPVPKRPKGRHVCRSAKAAALDALADPSPAPDEAAEEAEQVEAQSARAASALLLPTLLIGQRLTPWPGPGFVPAPGRFCPACGGRTLDTHVYCLCCDRWGLDALLALLPAPSPRQAGRACPVPVPVSESLDERERRRLKARRKAKRQAKALANAEAERPRNRKPPERRAVEPIPAASGPGQAPAPEFRDFQSMPVGPVSWNPASASAR